MTKRVYNFNAGPSTMPLAALERAQAELLDYQGTGMSIMEHSHRAKHYEAVHDECIKLITELLGVPDTHQVLFMTGGASAQFAILPMNLRTDESAGDYIVTGTWAEKAWQEAKIVGKPSVAWDGKKGEIWDSLPKQSDLKLNPNAPYLHFTTNNTIMGTQFFEFPDSGNVPLVADMSSDIMWRPIDVSKFGMIYAGAQKNMGPAGVTLVIIRKDLIEKGRKDIPKAFRFSEVAKNNSLQNTIPTFPVYMIRNVMDVVKAEGGLAAMEKKNRKKGEILYSAVDGSGGFYRCPVEKSARSVMNAVFRLPSEELEEKFVKAASAAGMVGLKGHRSVGGIRASMYNALSIEAVEKLAELMAKFQKENS